MSTHRIWSPDPSSGMTPTRHGPVGSQWNGTSGYGLAGSAPNSTGPIQNTASRSVTAKSCTIDAASTAIGDTTSRRPCGSAA